MSAERTVNCWDENTKLEIAGSGPYEGASDIQQRVETERYEAIHSRAQTEKKHKSGVSPFVFNFSMAIIVWFFTVLGASIWLINYPAIMVLFYILTSAITYSVYAFDKDAARQGHRGVSNSILHLLSLIGGWPGALFAQCMFNHKYQDKWFASMFWCSVMANFGLFVWTFTDTGNGYLLSAVNYLRVLLS